MKNKKINKKIKNKINKIRNIKMNLLKLINKLNYQNLNTMISTQHIKLIGCFQIMVFNII